MWLKCINIGWKLLNNGLADNIEGANKIPPDISVDPLTKSLLDTFFLI